MCRETVRVGLVAAWFVSGWLSRPGPIKMRAGDGGIILQGCVRCREWTAAHPSLREDLGACLGRFCLKRVARVPGPIKPQSCRGGIPSGDEVAL